MKKRTDREILDDLVAAVCVYDSLRDDEWDFQDKHRNLDFWSDEEYDEHDELLDKIAASRRKVRDLIVEATGDCNISF